MIRMFVVPLLLLGLCLSCMGQTFQYSRGWTNGKRASSDMDVLNPFNVGDSVIENKLERCLMLLQRCSHLSLKGGVNKKFYKNGSPEMFDELSTPDTK
uniref:Pro-corazonin n=1 Tax=Megaselia scalaris TaxID=36166 RepID=A0A2H4Z8K2_MEGSC|nr:preprocorazonin [Megaselia scalaris]